MGKGIKMRSAQDGAGNSYTVEQLQRLEDNGQAAAVLQCDDPSCACAVRFVPRHQKNHPKRSEPIDVPAYIGLTSNSEHAERCRYNASARLSAIAATSERDFLTALGDGKRELRLLALHNGLRKAGLSGNAPAALGGGGVRAGAHVTTEFQASERRLDSYLRTTADLVALRALCESDALLASELTLRFGTKRIPWKWFFFESDRLDEAWDLIKNGEGATYPVAISATVRSHRQPAAGAAYKSSFLNCKSRYFETDDPNRRMAFEVSVAHADGAWLASFPIGSEIVMFGIWKAADATARTAPDKRDPGRTVTYVTHKLMLSPRFKKQVVAVS